MKKIKSKIILWFLHLFDYRLSPKAKRNILWGLLTLVTLGFFGFIVHNIIQSHNEGESVRRSELVNKTTKEVVSDYADDTFAKEHLSLSQAQWQSKESNFDYSLAKTYTTYLASVEDSKSAERAYSALPWVSSEVSEPLLHWSNETPSTVTKLLSLRTLSRVYTSKEFDKWFGLFDVTSTNTVGTEVHSLVSVEMVVKGGRVSYWKIEEGGFR
jgi:hypothetical protein